MTQTQGSTASLLPPASVAFISGRGLQVPKKSMFQALVEGCHMLVPAPPHKGSEGTAAWEIRNKGPGQ